MEIAMQFLAQRRLLFYEFKEAVGMCVTQILYGEHSRAFEFERSVAPCVWKTATEIADMLDTTPELSDPERKARFDEILGRGFAHDCQVGQVVHDGKVTQDCQDSQDGGRNCQVCQDYRVCQVSDKVTQDCHGQDCQEGVSQDRPVSAKVGQEDAQEGLFLPREALEEAFSLPVQSGLEPKN